MAVHRLRYASDPSWTTPRVFSRDDLGLWCWQSLRASWCPTSRWKIERTIAWLLVYRRLTVRCERHTHLFSALITLAPSLTARSDQRAGHAPDRSLAVSNVYEQFPDAPPKPPHPPPK